MADLENQWTKKVVDKLGEFQTDERVDDKKLASFFDQMDAKNEPAKPFNWMRVAASIALLIAAGFIVYVVNNESIETTAGQMASISLPDGSIVELGGSSSLSFNKMSWRLNRSVDLEGEGYFKVEKGSTFTVNSALGQTEVLGTQFNVLASKSLYSVTCYEGKVKVSSGSEDVEIVAGGKVELQGGKLRKADHQLLSPSWIQGSYEFEGTSLGVVLDQLSRAYDLEVEIDPELLSEEYTGYFPTDDIEMAMKLVLDPMGMEYKKRGQKVSVKKKKKTKK